MGYATVHRILSIGVVLSSISSVDLETSHAHNAERCVL